MTFVLYDDIIFIIATFFNESEYYDFVKYFKLEMTLDSYFTVYNKYNQRIDIDEYLKSIYYDIYRTVDEQKYLKIVKSLDKTKSVFTEDSIRWASSYGFLQILKILHNIRIFEGFFEMDEESSVNKLEENAIDIACENGHFAVVKYLYTIGYRPTVDYAFHCACCKGHLSIVGFLYTKGYTWSHDTMEYVIKNNKLNIVKYLYSIGYQITKETIYICYQQYNNNIFRYFQRLEYCNDIIHEAILESISANNCKLFAFLQYNKNNINNIYLTKALKTNKYNIINFIQKNNNKLLIN
jgi:hypothetical protein